MDRDKYQYPVFFESQSLDPLLKDKLKKYFEIRRKSGGGECSQVEFIFDHIYKISFVDRTAQERVLQKAHHVLELPGGPISLTLRGILEPPATSTSPVSRQKPLPVHSALPDQKLPTSCLEHELYLDCYLLRYLKEIPGAEQDLQQQLSSVGCSVQLHPEEGKATVRGLGQAGTAGVGDSVSDVLVVQQWKAQVETLVRQVQERYTCHYEVDPGNLQTLLQSSTLGSEDVRVYGEGGQGFAVVVGVEAAVQAKLNELKAFQCLGSGKQKTIKTTCRLGQAKLRLLGEVIEKELAEVVPGVKVTRSDSSQLVLEGSANEVQTARELVTDKTLQVLEQVVPGLSQNLLSFLKANYVRPGALGILLGLGGQVEMELGNTELWMFTLSREWGEMAEKALLRVFVEEEIDLPNCASLLAELSARLDKKVNGMNQNRCRVVVRYGPGCRVQLLGHRKQVQELRDEIGDFLIDQSSRRDVRCPQQDKGESSGCEEVSRTTKHASQSDITPVSSKGSATPEVCLQVDIVQGCIEKQKVDALVSPMVGSDPTSSRVGNVLLNTAGPELLATFNRQLRKKTLPGDTVLVEGLSGFSSSRVFYLSLARWDDNPDGPAVQALRQGVRSILTSCEARGFCSVAFPVVGTGVVLKFPNIMVAQVLLEEIQGYEQNRVSSSSFLVRIVIHPNDIESTKAFQTAKNALQLSDRKMGGCANKGSNEIRIVLLGKTGGGKSSSGNTMFGQDVFLPGSSPASTTQFCESKTKNIKSRQITVIDTPGLFDTSVPEVELKLKIVNCITECAPGPHAFLIVLKVERYTVHEKETIAQIERTFSPEAFKYATVLFTHGDDLNGLTIEEFVQQNDELKMLVEKCGGRCHVIDNKHWNDSDQGQYRNNQNQVSELLNTIEKMVRDNGGGCYTNEMLQAAEREIQEEIETLRKENNGQMSEDEMRKQAKARVSKKLLIKLTGITVGAIIGAFLGAMWTAEPVMRALSMTSPGAIGLGLKVGAELAIASGLVGGTSVQAVKGAVGGGMVGATAAEEAESVTDAVRKAAKAACEGYGPYVNGKKLWQWYSNK